MADQWQVTVRREKLEVMPSFCDLGECLSLGGGCELTSIARCRATWGKFNELPTILTSPSFPITSRGRVSNLGINSTMLHASEISAPTSSNLHPLRWPRYDPHQSTQMAWPCGTRRWLAKKFPTKLWIVNLIWRKPMVISPIQFSNRKSEDRNIPGWLMKTRNSILVAITYLNTCAVCKHLFLHCLLICLYLYLSD